MKSLTNDHLDDVNFSLVYELLIFYLLHRTKSLLSVYISSEVASAASIWSDLYVHFKKWRPLNFNAFNELLQLQTKSVLLNINILTENER